MTEYYRLPSHIREALARDSMLLQRKHDQEVAEYRLATGADIWKPQEAGR